MKILVLLVAFFTPALSNPDLPPPSLARAETAQIFFAAGSVTPSESGVRDLLDFAQTQIRSGPLRGFKLIAWSALSGDSGLAAARASYLAGIISGASEALSTHVFSAPAGPAENEAVILAVFE